MENFTNETLDISQLPKYEEVNFTKLEPTYWYVVLSYTVLLFAIIAVGLFLGLNNIDEWEGQGAIIWPVFGILFGLTLLFSRIGFAKKSFAFRNHDVLFRYGVIATTTIVIPYNRVQHVSLHEGLLSRYFKLATVQVFTAGGSSSDIEIPGIAKNQAEDIKQLLMGKIQKQL